MKNLKEIENALKLHINYKGIPSNGKYLKIMDSLTFSYSGAPGIRVSKLLDDYYAFVGVKNLDEALNRLKKIEKH